MKGLKVALLVALASVAVPHAQAAQLPVGDPVVKTGGGSVVRPATPEASTAPAAIIVFDFDIFSRTGSSPLTSPCVLEQGNLKTVSPRCLFQNDITVDGVGQTITTLTFDAFGIDPNTVNCGFLIGSPFGECGVDPLPHDAGTEITFFGGSIPFETDFSLDFYGFPADFTFPTQATPATPEPGTASLLLLGGLAAMLVRRKARVRLSL